jgi:hypothetical protein
LWKDKTIAILFRLAYKGKKMKTFELNEKEMETLQKWINMKDIKNAIKDGNCISYTFIPTGIGIKIVVKCGSFEKDISDYESW